MLRLALGFAALLHVDAFVVCREREVAFYHVPKCAGLSITDALLATGGCVRLWYMLSMSSQIVRDRMDRCHTTPSEVERFATRDRDADFRAIDVEGVQRRYRSFSSVRHPYTRVLASFDQRTTTELLGKPGVEDQLPGYDRFWPCEPPACRHAPHPTTFGAYLEWLDANLANGTLAWWHDPTITHFRPATMFTHWPDGSRAVTHVAKFERLEEDLRRIFPRLGLEVGVLPRENVKSSPRESRGRLCGPKHCDPCALLTQTRHTAATIRIVNRVYKRDFELLGYAMLDGEPQEVLSHCLRRGLNHSLSQAVLAPHEDTASAA